MSEIITLINFNRLFGLERDPQPSKTTKKPPTDSISKWDCASMVSGLRYNTFGTTFMGYGLGDSTAPDYVQEAFARERPKASWAKLSPAVCAK